MTDRTSIAPLKFGQVRYSVGDGEPLIDEMSMVLGEQPRTVILGPNGAGKSLLLRLAHGLITPTQGTIRWAGPGASTLDRREIQRRQAMVFQRPVMLRRSAGANIDFALKVNGVSGAAVARRRDDALAATGLGHLRQRAARVLSSGEQQRLALARAWALLPDVLFLDEPTANLDPTATRQVESAIGGIVEAGTRIIMTTHDLGQARRLADEVVFLARGRLVEQASATAFFESPKAAESAAFISGDLPW